MPGMTVQRLHDLFDKKLENDTLVWEGSCHDCQKPVKVTATLQADGIHIKGGSVYEPVIDRFIMKCDGCFGNNPVLRNYQDCEVYSRVVGYLRPVNQWNDAKYAEFNDRKMFDSSMQKLNL
ncbi:MAG: anaerobic ribonucleoside-triphosphate reductase [Proteobacteria bacterium]|nr:anaerobic ribonucleoside-triphosphate reductase [Pseudomonadota bacterium]